jgi:hypothetical protein
LKNLEFSYPPSISRANGKSEAKTIELANFASNSGSPKVSITEGKTVVLTE